MALSLLVSTFNARLPKLVVVALFSLSIGSVANNLRGSDPVVEGVSSREARLQAIQAVPFKQLSQSTSQALREVLENPSFYRRMPTQTIQCDPELFSFVVRKPEVMVNTWDLMGITKVTAKRTGPYSFLANDGVGTKCKCDLVYGKDNIHIYYGAGDYDGSMTARTIKGRAVCILRSESQPYPEGHSGHVVRGTMDVFLKLDNLGADLLTRTFGPLVAKTADHNFAETAQFVAQLSQVCANNPPAALGLVTQLNNVDEPVRQEFASIATRIAEENKVAKRALPTGAVANPALMLETLQELKVASMGSAQAQPLPAQKLTSSPLLLEQATTVPSMQSGFSLSDSTRKKHEPNSREDNQNDLQALGKGSTARLHDQPALYENSKGQVPSGIQPKKTGVTMRR